MAASRHKLSIAATSVEPFVRLQVGLDGNEVTIKNKTAANLNEGSLIITATRNIDLYASTQNTLLPEEEEKCVAAKNQVSFLQH